MNNQDAAKARRIALVLGVTLGVATVQPKTTLAGIDVASALDTEAKSSCEIQASDEARSNQDAPPAAQSSGRKVAICQLDEISVTARRRAENVLEVPVAVDTISAERLTEANITRMADLSIIEPGLTLTVGTVFPYAFLRGFGTGGDLSFEQTVGKFVDNVSYGRDQDILIPLYDIERIEVLRGPQVLLYGNSTTAGALNITTRKPGNEFEGYLTSSYEVEYDEIQVQGGVTVPFSDMASFRVAGMVQDRGGGPLYNPFIDKEGPQYDNWAVRPYLRFTPTPELTIDVHGEYAEVRTDGGTLQQFTQPFDPAIRRFPVVGRGDVRTLAEGAPPFFTFDSSGIDHEIYQLDVNYDALGGTFTSTTAYRELAAFSVLTLSNTDPFFLTSHHQDYTQFSQELRFTGSYEKFDVTGGAFYERYRHKTGSAAGVNPVARIPVANIPPVPPPAFGTLTKVNVLSESISGFGELTYHVSDVLRIAVGARYTHLEKTGGKDEFAINAPTNLTFDTGISGLDQFINPAFDGIVMAAFGASLVDFPYGALQRTEESLQPQVILQYDVMPSSMVYAKYVKGEKAGGFDYSYSGAIPEEANFRPEQAESFELGAKGQVLNDTLAYTLATYHVTFTDLQNAVFSQNTLVLDNVGEARSMGVELGLTYVPMTGLTLGLNVDYMDAEYVDFPEAVCTSYQNFIVGAGCRQDLSGTPTRFSSKWSGSASANYEWIASNFAWQAGGSVFARSSYNPGGPRDPLQQQEPYAQLDAHLSMSPLNGFWSVLLFGRNLTDERVLTFGGNTPFNGTSTLGGLSDGIQYGVRLTAEF